jgi:hypothetical protein
MFYNLTPYEVDILLKIKNEVFTEYRKSKQNSPKERAKISGAIDILKRKGYLKQVQEKLIVV